MVGESAAEDVLQDAFVRAYKAYDGYQEQGFLRSWLRTIAHNAALSYLQKAALYQAGGLYGDDPDDDLIGRLVDTGPSVEDQVVAELSYCTG